MIQVAPCKTALMFLDHINNTEHNLKQIIYTGMGVIPLIPP